MQNVVRFLRICCIFVLTRAVHRLQSVVVVGGRRHSRDDAASVNNTPTGAAQSLSSLCFGDCSLFPWASVSSRDGNAIIARWMYRQVELARGRDPLFPGSPGADVLAPRPYVKQLACT